MGEWKAEGGRQKAESRSDRNGPIGTLHTQKAENQTYKAPCRGDPPSSPIETATSNNPRLQPWGAAIEVRWVK